MSLDSEMAYNLETVRKLTSLTPQQIRYWDKTGLVRPSLGSAKGRGSKRLYSFEDLVELRTIARLLTAGISLQKIRPVTSYIRETREIARPMASLRFLTDGDSLFISADDNARWEDALKGGQVVWLVPVDDVWKATEAEVRGIGEPVSGSVKVGKREYGVVYEPDLEDGGWVAECVDVPGCISQGDTMTEARRMIRDAIATMTIGRAARKKATRAQ